MSPSKANLDIPPMSQDVLFAFTYIQGSVSCLFFLHLR